MTKKSLEDPSDNIVAFDLSHVERKLEAKERAQREAHVSAQVEAGRCDIIPLPGRCESKPFRADVYTEALPLFVANSFRGQSREQVWHRKHPESDEPIVDRLVIGKMNSSDRERGVLKQVHQDALYQLLRLWGERGYEVTRDKDGTPLGVLKLSSYELVRALRGDDAAHHYRTAQNLLADLAGIPVVRKIHYQWRDECDEAKFTLLGDVLWEGRKLDPKTGRPRRGGESLVTIQFSRFLTRQFLEHKVKQLLLVPYMQLARTGGRRAELAPLLYTRLDRELATKDRYHVKLAALFEELGLTVYRYKSKRREKAEPAVEALNGLPILGERFTLRVELRVAADGSDYVLIAKRVGQEPLPHVE